jgi:adenosine deaminase
MLTAKDKKLMTQLCEAEIVLEISPDLDLLTKALPDEEAVRDTFRAFSEHGVPFTIATDGPEMEQCRRSRRPRTASAESCRPFGSRSGAK